MSKKKNKTGKAEMDTDEIKELKRKLADAQLKIVALDTLIDVAEDQLKINIRNERKDSKQ